MYFFLSFFLSFYLKLAMCIDFFFVLTPFLFKSSHVYKDINFMKRDRWADGQLHAYIREVSTPRLHSISWLRQDGLVCVRRRDVTEDVRFTRKIRCKCDVFFFVCVILDFLCFLLILIFLFYDYKIEILLFLYFFMKRPNQRWLFSVQKS